MFRNVCISNPGAGELPRRKHTTRKDLCLQLDVSTREVIFLCYQEMKYAYPYLSRSAIFWKTARHMVISTVANSYRSFGKSYRSIFLILEDGTDKLSRNVGKKLPLYAAQFCIRAQISTLSWRKPDNTQISSYLSKLRFVFLENRSCIRVC